MRLQRRWIEVKTHFTFGGCGAGAMGFNVAQAEVPRPGGGMYAARYRCLGAVDSNPIAVRNFGRLVGVPATCLDLFTLEQFRLYHSECVGKRRRCKTCSNTGQPPPGWREATPDDILASSGGESPDVEVITAPCKGYSQLVAGSRSRRPRYQALNQLAERGLQLALETYADDPPAFILFENVPRIVSKGRALLDRIHARLAAAGYISVETQHCCGELGGLAQRRPRFLLVARHREKVPNFLYEPPKRALRSVGEVIDQLPLPGAPAAGPMHSYPGIKPVTEERLAMIPPGGDWRNLNDLAVEDGHLRDFVLVCDADVQALEVTERSGVDWFRGCLGVRDWNDPTGTVTGESSPTNGANAIADPRPARQWGEYGAYGVLSGDQSAGCITGMTAPGNGRFSIADPRTPHLQKGGSYFDNVFRVVPINESAYSVIGATRPGSGCGVVAQPIKGLSLGRVAFNDVYRVVPVGEPTTSVTGGRTPSAGGQAVAQPLADLRCRTTHEGGGKYKVTQRDQPAGVVIAASSTGNGAFAVADRLADPRCRTWREGRSSFNSGGHYGVIPRGEPSYVVTGGKYDNSPSSVADHCPEEIWSGAPKRIIISPWGFWHRPFTLLEKALFQTFPLIINGQPLNMEGSKTEIAEEVGNALPVATATAIAEEVGRCFLMAVTDTSRQLQLGQVWVDPFGGQLWAALSMEVGLW